MITHIVTDIEGTTTAVSFVTEVLFTYAAAELPGFITTHRCDPIVRRHVDGLARSGGVAADDDAGLAALIHSWISADRKDSDLKALQGLVWDEGYRHRHFAAHVYPEVPVMLRRWHAAGYRLAVFSSGSIQAQRLLFSHTVAGDLSGLFSDHFDTTIGSKRESAAYARICAVLQVALPENVLFLSDIVAELDAAAVAGMRTQLICRDLPLSNVGHPTANDFTAVHQHWNLVTSGAAGSVA